MAWILFYKNFNHNVSNMANCVFSRRCINRRTVAAREPARENDTYFIGTYTTNPAQYQLKHANTNVM